MKYYTAQEIQEMTGLSKSGTYKLIKDLNDKLKKEYRGTIILKGKIPKWFFDKKMMIERSEENEKENQ